MSDELPPTLFTFPEKVNDTIRSGKNAGNPKSKTTINLYRALMHQITRASGFNTIKQMMKSYAKTNKAIKQLTVKKDGETDLAHKARVRNYYSALFYVLPEKYLSKPNPFYKAYQAWKDQIPSK